MGARVICISFATATGAEAIATSIAKDLGFRCINEEVIGRAAELQNLDPEDVADAEKRKSLLAKLLDGLVRARASEATAYVPDSKILKPTGEDLRSLIQQAIREIAEQGNVVIVAHAASYALSKRNDVLRVLITGSQDVRAGRLAASEGKTPGDAKKAIRQSDEGRADYLKKFYGVDNESASYYDITISTDALSPTQTAKLIIDAAGAIGG